MWRRKDQEHGNLPKVTHLVKAEGPGFQLWHLTPVFFALFFSITDFHETEGTVSPAVDAGTFGAYRVVSDLGVRSKTLNLDSVFQLKSFFFTSIISSDPLQ